MSFYSSNFPFGCLVVWSLTSCLNSRKLWYEQSCVCLIDPDDTRCPANGLHTFLVEVD